MMSGSGKFLIMSICILLILHFPILPNQTAILDCEHRTRSGDGDIRCDWFVVASHTIR
jgi:hypothetical protein